MIYVTAILIGLAGGLHCAGMCAPLVLAATARNPFLHIKFIYTAGRILTYGLLGTIAASIGTLAQLSKYQEVFAVVIGATLFLIGLGVISGMNIPFITRSIYRLTSWVKTGFGRFLKKGGRKATFALGILNGFLPCGLTYLAMTYCLTLDYVWQGFFFMVLFGVGTVPLMTGATWLIGRMVNRVKLGYQKISMFVLVVIGTLIMARSFVFQPSHSMDDSIESGTQTEVLCR